MRDRSARRRERLASNAGIAEQVQKGGIGRVRNPFAQPVPYRRHIRTKAQMLERPAPCSQPSPHPDERLALGGHGPTEQPAPTPPLHRPANDTSVGRPNSPPG